ncbi:MFS transporter [Maribacter algarum]|uniref:MFS transporter n=1 Tax=Maribacter algarum (ex Zhang et al. 2020) TaxID=2578118 RepID=A0A5S3PXC6_9FLAO|nr:MFS transporter [Maribacter algarum]TMM57917.1 MFS transporter [Maribacter algarum]
MTEPTANLTVKYRGYTLFILTVVYVFNFIDRQILVILQESIKQELGLSDTQLGLMSGFTFAIFYVSFGIPIARLADKGNRRNIIAISLAVWSAFTALSGSAQNFIQLLLARIGVGIGEAGGSPPAHSIISDLYPAKKRATALAIYSTGISIGILLGFLLGGWINQYFGWRTAFLVVGIPGILFALILRFTVKEPPRGLSEKEKDLAEQQHSMKDVFRLLRNKKSFRYIAVGAGLAAYVSYTISSWLPPFMARVHGMSSGEIGTWLSLIFGIGTGVGYFMGGYLTDRLSKKDMRWYLWLPAMALLFAIPLALVAFFATAANTTLFAIIIPAFLNSLYLAPCIALTHGIVNVRMRALASAILFFVLNIIGLGFGPFVGGIISDALQPTMGVDALRWALSNSVIASILSAFCFYIASKSIRKDLI